MDTSIHNLKRTADNEKYYRISACSSQRRHTIFRSFDNTILISMKYFLSFIFSLLLLTSQAQNAVLEKFAGIPSSSKVYDIQIDKKESVWVATDNGLYKITGGQTQDIYTGIAAYAIAVHQDDSYTGLSNNNILKNDTKVFTLPEKEVRIESMEAHENKLWVGTNKGVFAYNLKTLKLIKHYKKSNSKFESDRVNFLYRDKNKILWIGTDKGVMRIDGDDWKLEDKKKKFIAAIENEEGMWLLDEEEMHLIEYSKRWYPIGLSQGLYKGRINDIILDNTGNLYVASNNLVRLNPYTDEVEEYTEALGYLSKECLALASDPNGNIWVGTKRSGLYKIKFTEEENVLSAICIVENEISCDGVHNAAIEVKTSGGTEPFTFTWSDDKLAGANPQNVSPGDYELEITDKNNQKFVQKVSIKSPEPLSGTIVETKRIQNSGKKDGYAKVRVQGGKSPYKISWASGEDGIEAFKLSPGEQLVTIKDANNCSTTLALEIKNAKLIPDLDISKVTVGQTLQVNQIYFDADSTNITENSFAVLNEIFDFLNENENIVIEIGGHTNGIPSHEYCDALSASRAKSIAGHLYQKGMPESRINYKGYGKREPIADNNTVAGRKKNQRVEIKILAISE